MYDLPPVAADLLRWFDANKRVLPFRTESTPYRVWISEIMLQQTRVSAAMPYFERFVAELPGVQALAECEEEKLHKLWEGLGYYSRVRNLQKAAKMVMEQYGGQLPADYALLQKLPGIGEYTAGAIASISFGLPVVAVDGNVLRVFSRLLNDDGNILHPDTKKAFSAVVQSHQPPQRAGAYNEALMELGALVCTPTSPKCTGCPLQTQCAAYDAGTQETLPHKTPLKSRRVQEYTVLLVQCHGKVLLCRRPDSGLLAGLWQPLLQEEKYPQTQAKKWLCAQGFTVSGIEDAGKAKHIFTHLEWHMTGYLCTVEEQLVPADCVWATRQEVEDTYTLPNAFKGFRKQLLQIL